MTKGFADAGSAMRANQASPGSVSQASELDRDLLDAVEGNDARRVQALLTRGANPDAKSTSGYAPLHLAAWVGHVDVVRVLLAGGADPAARSTVGAMTALGMAASFGRMQVVRTLLEVSEVDARNEQGSTPLHFAAFGGHVAVAGLLLGAGADKNARNLLNRTPLHLAAERGHAESVHQLLVAGADIDARDTAGQRPDDGAHKAVQPLFRAFRASHKAAQRLKTLVEP